MPLQIALIRSRLRLTSYS